MFLCYRFEMTKVLTYLQITLVKDTTSDKKKKAHQGYAFVVYEREKDMKGNTSMLILLALIQPTS